LKDLKELWSTSPYKERAYQEQLKEFIWDIEESLSKLSDVLILRKDDPENINLQEYVIQLYKLLCFEENYRKNFKIDQQYIRDFNQLKRFIII
jgi:glutathionyl-hydroquinone reductase